MDFSNIPVYDQVIGFAIPVFFIFIFFEIGIRAYQKLPPYDYRDSGASVFMGFVAAILNSLLKILVILIFYKIYEYRLFDLGNGPIVWILLFFLEDFSFYLHHRACHTVRLFWAGHVNHHSAQTYNLSVALRQSWGELAHKYIWWFWLPFLGFHPVMVLTFMSISLIYQFFLHTEVVKKMGFLELVFNTPSHHRVHHASNDLYLDRNHGAILIVWDKLFGTFQSEKEEIPVSYGIRTNITSHNPLTIASHEYLNLAGDLLKERGFINRLKLLFYPPGWSSDGKGLTSDQIRKDWKNRKSENGGLSN